MLPHPCFSRSARYWFVLLPITAGLLGTLAADIAAGDTARHGESAITCTNPASGVSWQVRIDYDKGTVDFKSGTYQRVADFVARRKIRRELHA